MPLNAHLKVKSELLMGMMDIVEKHTSGVAFPVEVEDPYAFETKKRFGGFRRIVARGARGRRVKRRTTGGGTGEG